MCPDISELNERDLTFSWNRKMREEETSLSSSSLQCRMPFSYCPGLETLKFFHSGLRTVLVTSLALVLRTICLPSSLQTAPSSWLTCQQINLCLRAHMCALCSFVPMCVCVRTSVSQQTPRPMSIELLHVFVESYLRSLTWWYRHVLNSHFQDAEATERHCEFQTTLSYKKTKK